MSSLSYKIIAAVSFVFFVVLGYFVSIGEETITSLNLKVFETLIYSDIAQHQTFWRTVTALGGPYFLGFLTILTTLYFWIKKDYRDTKIYLVGMFGGALLVGVLKYITASERPHFISAIERTFSFPSGHTALSVIFLIISSYIYTKNMHHKHKLLIYVSCAIISIMIALSRLYLGEHWLTDIFGGYLLAFAYSFFCIDILRRRRAQCIA